MIWQTNETIDVSKHSHFLRYGKQKPGCDWKYVANSHICFHFFAHKAATMTTEKKMQVASLMTLKSSYVIYLCIFMCRGMDSVPKEKPGIHLNGESRRVRSQMNLSCLTNQDVQPERHKGKSVSKHFKMPLYSESSGTSDLAWLIIYQYPRF